MTIELFFFIHTYILVSRTTTIFGELVYTVLNKNKQLFFHLRITKREVSLAITLCIYPVSAHYTCSLKLKQVFYYALFQAILNQVSDDVEYILV